LVADTAGERNLATGKRPKDRYADHPVAGTEEKAPAVERSNQRSVGRSIMIATSLVGQPVIRRLQHAAVTSLQQG
jgi:hypothetical protein